jgi:uncharacterized membrane protein YebE (DUF533 family)
MNLDDLLGSVVQSGMSNSTNARLKNSFGGGGMLESLGGLLGGAGGGAAQGAGGGLLGGLGGMLGGAGSGAAQGAGGGLLGGMLGGGAGGRSQAGGALGGGLADILQQAGQAVGGTNNLALGGLGALAGALLGGGKRSMGGALGGGLMAMLGVMAFQALRNRAGQKATVPLGLAVPQTAAQKAELGRNTGLVLRAMVNAAKADGKIDSGEIERLMGKVRESGVDAEAQQFLQDAMGRPMETDELIAAARGKPELAAQLYAASLLAIEVDTPAEKKYLESLAAGLGLEPAVTGSLRQAVGL